MEFHESPVSDDSILVNYLPHLKLSDIKREIDNQNIAKEINVENYHDDYGLMNLSSNLTDTLTNSLKDEQLRREKVGKKSFLSSQDIQRQVYYSRQSNGRIVSASPFTSPENMFLQRSKIQKMQTSLQNKNDDRDKHFKGKRTISFTTPIKKFRFQSTKQRSSTFKGGNGSKFNLSKYRMDYDSSPGIINHNALDDVNFDVQENRDIALQELSTCSSRIINQILASTNEITGPMLNKLLWKSLSSFNILSLHLWQALTKIDEGDLVENITFVSERLDGIMVKTDANIWERLLTSAEGLERQSEVTVTLTRDDNLWPEVVDILKTMEPNSTSAFRNSSLWTTIFIIRLPMLLVHSKSMKPGILVAASTIPTTTASNTTNGGKFCFDVDNQIMIQTLQRISWAIAVTCTLSTDLAIQSDNFLENNNFITTSKSEQHADNKKKENLLRLFEEETDRITDTTALMKILVTFSLQLLECENVWIIHRNNSQNLTTIIGGDPRSGICHQTVVLNDSTTGKNLAHFLSKECIERSSITDLRSLQLLVGEITDEDLTTLSLPLFESKSFLPSTDVNKLFSNNNDENLFDEKVSLLLGFSSSIGVEQSISDHKLSLAKSIASIAKTSFLRTNYQNDFQRLGSLNCMLHELLNPVDEVLRNCDNNNRECLNTLLEIVNTDQFATALGARKSVLLIPSASYDSFYDKHFDPSYSLIMKSQSILSSQYIYFMSNGSNRRSKSSSSDGLRYLKVGQPFVDKSSWHSTVFDNASSTMSTILIHAPIQLSDSNSLSIHSSTVRHIEEKQDQILHRKLYEMLILPIDSEAMSAIIIPIQSGMGILLLILFDKLDNTDTVSFSSPISGLGSESGAALLKRRRFSSKDSQLIDRSAIHQSLSLTVQTIMINHKLEKTHLRIQQKDFDLQHLSGVLDQVALSRSRKRLQTRTFSAWRDFTAKSCAARRQITAETQTDNQLDIQDYHRIVLALLDGGYRSLDNIIDRISQLLVNLFPSDEVTVSLSSDDTIFRNNNSYHPDSYDEVDNHEQWKLSCKILVKGVNDSDCLANVTIIRRNLIYPFSADDRKLLSSISDIISLSLRVLPLEVFIEEGLGKGVRGKYIMDYMQQCITYLTSIRGVEQKSKAVGLTTHSISPNDILSDSLYIDFLTSTVKNLKKLTGADAVSLRIKWVHIYQLKSPFSHVDADHGTDLVVSSKDAPCLSINQTKPLLQARNYSESGNEVFESTINIAAELQNDRSQSDYLSMKLYDENDTSEFGEIRLMKHSESQEFSSQQQMMVTLAGQMVVMFISQCNTYQNNRNNLRNSQELLAKLDRSLSTVSEELNTQHNHFTILHRMHNNLLELLHLHQYLAFHCNSIEGLAAKITEFVQSLIPNTVIYFYLLVEGENDGNLTPSNNPSDIYYEEVMTSNQSDGIRLEDSRSHSRKKNIRKISDFKKLSPFSSVKKSYNNMLDDEVLYLKNVDSSSSPLGIFLITNSYLIESHTVNISSSEWKEQEEILLTSLSSSVALTLTKLKSKNSIRTIEEYHQSLCALNRIFDKCSAEKEDLSEFVNHLKKSNESLQNSIDDMQEKFAEESNESKEKISQLELQQDHLINNLKTSEKETNVLKREFVELQSDWNYLLNTIEEYSVEGRSHTWSMSIESSPATATNATWEWLRDIASSRNYEMTVISRNGDGMLSGGCDGKGVYPIVSEAIRTGQVIEQKTILNRSQLVSSGEKILPPMMQREGLGHDKNDIRIINVPNKSVAPSQASYCACFQFYCLLEQEALTRYDFSESSAKRDREMFQCAVGLVCHSLQSKTQTSQSESKQLQRQQQMTVTLISKLYECTTAFESIWKRGAKDISELTSLIENFASRLILRSDLDPCSTVSYLWFPPQLSSSTSTSPTTSAAFSVTFPQQLGFGEESVIAQRAYNSGKSQRRLGVLWIPILNSIDSLPIALLRIERKPGSDIDDSNLSSSSVDVEDKSETNTQVRQKYYPEGARSQGIGFQPSKKTGKHLTDHTKHDDDDLFLFPYKRYQVKISKQEEEIMQYFCRLLVPLFDKDRLTKEISNSVQQAGKAIQLLQSSKAQLQDKLTVEISQRVAMVDLMKGVTELLDVNLQEKLTMKQVLQLVHRIATSVTSSHASFLVYPQNTLDEVDEITESTNDFKSGANVTTDSYKKEDIDDTGSHKYFTLSVDNHVLAPIRVNLESSDIEMLVLLTKRIIGTGDSTFHQSWAIRRIQERFQKSRDPNDDSVNSESESYFAVAVPVMFDRGVVAVLTTARSGIPYSQLERDCLYWLGTTLTYMRLQGHRSDDFYDRNFSRQPPPPPPPLSSQDKHSSSDSITQSNIYSHTGQRSSKATNLEVDFQSILKYVTSPYLDILKNQIQFYTSSTYDADDIDASLPLDIIVAVCEIVFKGSKAVAWTTTTTSSTRNLPTTEHHLLGFPAPLEPNNGANLVGANSNTIHTNRGKLTYWITRSQHQQQPVHHKSANQYFFQPEKLRKFNSVICLLGLVELDGCSPISIKIMIADDLTKTSAYWELRCSLLMLLLTIEECHRQSLQETIISVKKDLVPLLNESELKFNQLKTVNEKLQSQLKSTTTNYEQQLLLVEERHHEIMRHRHSQYEVEVASENRIIAFKRNLFHNTINSIDRISRVRMDGVNSHKLEEILAILCQIFTTSPTATNANFSQIINVNGHIVNLSDPALPSIKTIRQETSGGNVNHIIESYQVKAAQSNKAFIIYLQNNSSKQLMEQCRTDSQYYQKNLSIFPMLPFEFICDITQSSSSTSTSTTNPIYFIVPVTLLSPNNTIILTITIVNNNDDHNGNNVNVGNVISMIMESVSILSLFLRQYIESNEQLDSIEIKVKQSAMLSALSMLNNICIRRHQFKVMSVAFHRLATEANLSKILRSLSTEGKVITNKQHVRNLEGSLADWSEIVKIVSGACEYVTLGLEGLWKELCGPIMSLLSSEISINGCGLFIEGENNEVIELRVVNLTTPLRFDSHFTKKEGNSRVAGRRGVIDKKSARDYGSRIEELCLSIFHNSYSIDDELDNEHVVSQRLWRLSKKDTVTENEEQLWLVPVRTARNIVGILRVNVDVGSTRGKIKQSDNYDVFDSYEDQDSRIATAEQKIVNISDTIAPLLFASCQMAYLNNTNDSMGTTLQSNITSLTCLSIQNSILFKVIDVITESLSKEPQQSDYENTKLSIQRRYEHALSNIFSGEVTIRFLSHENESLQDDKKDNDIQVIILKEPMISSQFNGFIQITISKSTIEKLWIKELNVFKNKNMNTTPSSTFNSEQRISDIAGRKANNLFRDLLPQLNEMDADHQEFLSTTLPSILKSLSAIISSLLINIDREVEAKKNVTKSVATLTALETVIKNLKTSRIELALREANAVSSEDNHKLLANCLTGYIMYCANAVHTMSKTSSENGLNYLKKVVIILSSLLSKDRPQLITRFAAISPAGVSFSSVGPAVGPPPSMTPLHWIQYPTDIKPVTETSYGSSILTNDNVKEIAENLAYSCLQKRVKTFVDVNAKHGHSSNASDSQASMSNTLYRITSLPVTHNTNIVGVLQVLVPSHSYLEKNGLEEYNKLEIDCERVAELIGCLVIILQTVENSHLAKPSTLDARCTKEELQTRLEAAEAAAEVWHQRCNAWKAVCLTGVTSFEKCLLPGAKAIKIIKDDFATCLQGTGVVVNVRKESSQVQQAVGSGQGPITSIIGSLNIIELNDSKKHVVEISCAVNVDQAGPDSLVSIADDLVYCLTVIVNSTISIITAKEKLEFRGNRRSKISDTKTLKLRTELATISSELHQSLTRNATLTADAAALAERHELTINHNGTLIKEAFTPAMNTMISLLETILVDDENVTTITGVFEENKLWHEYVNLLQRLAKNASFRSKYHITAIVKTENIEGKIRIFDGTTPDGIVMTLNDNIREPTLSTQQLAYLSSVEESFHTGNVSERIYAHHVFQDNMKLKLNIDFMGIDDSLIVNIASLSNNNNQILNDSHLRVISFPLLNTKINFTTVGVLKLIILESSHNKLDIEFQNIECNLMRSMIPILDNLFVYYYQLSLTQKITSTRKSIFDEHEKLLNDKMDRLKIQLSRARRLHRLVGRESLALSELSSTHEILLLRSSEKVTHTMIEKFCLKTLSITRNLIMSTSQAIILSDFNFNSTEVSFQLLYSGNVLSWPGVRAGSFAQYLLPPSSHLSIIGYVATRQKPLVLEDVTVDSRYIAHIDGVCAPKTPYMAVPLRGHQFLSIGILIFARKTGEIGFGAEELIAAEMLSYFCSLSLNYCNSLNQL